MKTEKNLTTLYNEIAEVYKAHGKVHEVRGYKPEQSKYDPFRLQSEMIIRYNYKDQFNFNALRFNLSFENGQTCLFVPDYGYIYYEGIPSSEEIVSFIGNMFLGF